jgi:hypothetical protein
MTWPVSQTASVVVHSRLLALAPMQETVRHPSLAPVALAPVLGTSAARFVYVQGVSGEGERI